MNPKIRKKITKGQNLKTVEYHNYLVNELNMSKTFCEYFLVIGIDPKISMRTYLYNTEPNELLKFYDNEIKPEYEFIPKMNFIYESELEAEPQLEKTKSHNIENDCLLNNFNRRKSKIKNKKNEIIPIEKNNDILSKNNNEAKQIFANFLDAINCLYKKLYRRF